MVRYGVMIVTCRADSSAAEAPCEAGDDTIALDSKQVPEGHGRSGSSIGCRFPWLHG